jgi:hypothetical protein
MNKNHESPQESANRSNQFKGESESSQNFELQFELLSAYLDGEVNHAEKQQVETWLDCDPSFYHLYECQLQIRQTLLDLPVPACASSNTELLIDQVMAKLSQQQKRRNYAFAGLAAIASLFSVLGSLFVFNPASMEWNTADNSDENLVLAMEHPIVPQSLIDSTINVIEGTP